VGLAVWAEGLAAARVASVVELGATEVAGMAAGKVVAGMAGYMVAAGTVARSAGCEVAETVAGRQEANMAAWGGMVVAYNGNSWRSRQARGRRKRGRCQQ